MASTVWGIYAYIYPAAIAKQQQQQQQRSSTTSGSTPSSSNNINISNGSSSSTAAQQLHHSSSSTAAAAAGVRGRLASHARPHARMGVMQLLRCYTLHYVCMSMWFQLLGVTCVRACACAWACARVRVCGLAGVRACVHASVRADLPGAPACRHANVQTYRRINLCVYILLCF